MNRINQTGTRSQYSGGCGVLAQGNGKINKGATVRGMQAGGEPKFYE